MRVRFSLSAPVLFRKETYSFKCAFQIRRKDHGKKDKGLGVARKKRAKKILTKKILTELGEIMESFVGRPLTNETREEALSTVCDGLKGLMASPSHIPQRNVRAHSNGLFGGFTISVNLTEVTCIKCGYPLMGYRGVVEGTGVAIKRLCKCV